MVILSWREIHGYEGYEVSNYGGVRSNKRGAKNKVLTPLMKNGYERVALYLGDRRKRKMECVHRLVLRAFDRHETQGEITRHLDGNRRNNRASNLKWGTAQENEADKRRHGRVPPPHKHPCSKLTPKDIPLVRDAEGNMNSTQAGKLFGVSRQIIDRIWGGLAWKGY